MSLWHEIEDLQKKKAELEFQLHSIEEKEKTLAERARMLEEKLAIHELEEHLKIKNETVEKLESRVRDLERRLKEPETSAIVNEPETKQNTSGYFLNKLFEDR